MLACGVVPGHAWSGWWPGAEEPACRHGGPGMISRRYRVVGLCVWPGLPQIWAGQVATGLLLASFFAFALNTSVLTQWVYTDWLEPRYRQVLWVVSLTFYAAMAAWTAVWAWKFHPEKFRLEIERLFRQSGDAYLHGRWAESRDQLERIVALDPSDTEALLRLARLLERTGQKELAVRVLHQCGDTPGAVRWQWEIDQMSRRLRAEDVEINVQTGATG